MVSFPIRSIAILAAMSLASTAGAQSVYLNESNMTVSLGGSMMDAEPFANRGAAESLASIIDLPSADAGELHNQQTHVWVSGSTLDLDFDFGIEYDLGVFHFWNYHSEDFDVDEIDLTFYDASMTVVGTLDDVSPALGNSTGFDSDPIFAQSIALDFPSNARYVNAVLSGTNGQVDFNNMGFTGVPSPIPEPATFASALLALSFLAGRRPRRT